MRLGITIVGDTLENFTRYVQQADRAGVAAIGSGDSQTLYGVLWVRFTLAGVHTTQAVVGPWATNPVTRHPSVTAGASGMINKQVVTTPGPSGLALHRVQLFHPG